MIHNLYNTICDLKHLKLEWLRIKNIYRFTIFYELQGMEH